MTAWKQEDGSYLLRNEGLSRETWRRKDLIRSLGGRWLRRNTCWVVPAEALVELGAKRMYGVIREPYCHEPIAFVFADEGEVKAGRMSRGFCTYCDSHWGRPAIIDVCGESDEARAIYEAEFRARIERSPLYIKEDVR
jgi:hypothetical protein